MVDLSENTMTQIIRERNFVWRWPQEDYRAHNYRNQDESNRDGYDRSLSAFPFDVSENLLLPGLCLRHSEGPAARIGEFGG